MIDSESNIAIARSCSNCGSGQVRRTHRSSGMDRLFSKMNFYPYYCQDCDVRSRRFGRK
jgi:hypothetical protein